MIRYWSSLSRSLISLKTYIRCLKSYLFVHLYLLFSMLSNFLQIQWLWVRSKLRFLKSVFRYVLGVKGSCVCDTAFIPDPHSQFSINIQLRKYIGRQPEEDQGTRCYCSSLTTCYLRGLDSNNIIDGEYDFVWGTF